MRIELLTKDNYDSWSMQVEALMTKNGTWKYTSGDLPPSFENFRCAIESRDELPGAEALKIKILEESEARCQKKRDEAAGAMVAWKKPKGAWKKQNSSQRNENHTNSNTNTKIKCFKCRKFGHKVTECPQNAKGHGAKAAQEPDAYIVCEVDQNMAYKTDSNNMDGRWCFDSGAPLTNASADIEAKGIVQLKISDGSTNRTVNLEETLLVPNLRTNLISVSKITDRGHAVIFRKSEAIVKGSDGSIKMMANRIGNLYYIRNADKKAQAASENQDRGKLALWHRRMGHLNVRDLVEMTKKRSISGVSIKHANNLPPCDTCMKGKLTQLSFTHSTSRSTERLSIVHTDLCGPMRIQSKGGAFYFVTFVDDCTRWCEIYFIKQKSDVLNAFKEFKTYAENQTGKRIKHLQSDNGREYCNGEFDTFLKEQGIRRRLTVPHTPQQNGVAERKNRTLVEMARCIMFQGNLQMSFWAEAVHAANYIRNRCASRSLEGRTPYEGWTGKIPDLRHLRVIGTRAYILDKTPAKGKFDARAKEGVLVGYS
ncbi:retrovirus-related pol polyprotein from transposon tnt 1-94, partial [Lasius niger]